MKNNNYTSFFKTKPKKVERYIRCRKCGGNMEWSRDFPPQIKCTKCGYTVYPQPYEPDCTKLPETWERYSELYEKARMKNELYVGNNVGRIRKYIIFRSIERTVQ